MKALKSSVEQSPRDRRRMINIKINYYYPGPFDVTGQYINIQALFYGLKAKSAKSKTCLRIWIPYYTHSCV